MKLTKADYVLTTAGHMVDMQSTQEKNAEKHHTKVIFRVSNEAAW